MKTNLFNFTKFLAIPVFLTMAVSCGSYQNSSYYDNDGIYGNYDNTRENSSVTNKYSEENLEKGNIYAERFKVMQDEYQDQYEYFTDVDNYNSIDNDTVVTVYNSRYNNQNSSWGENNRDVTINYYNNGWGWNTWNDPFWNWGWGWNSWNRPWGWNAWYGANWGWGWNSWYGPGWGWGWNNWYGANWGWGWNNWNNPYGYAFYGRNVNYNNGPRGARNYYNSNRGSNRSNVNFNRPRNTFSSNPRSSSNNNSYNNSGNRPRNTYSNPNGSSSPRYSSPRSSSSNSGGGRSYSGSSGGGRSSGGFSGGGSRGGGRGGRG